MENRKEMIEFAIKRMAGFTLEGSNIGDNRSIFSLVRSLLKSSHGTSLGDCREPLTVVLNMKDGNGRFKFMGCKITLLNKTITALFGEPGKLFADKGFKNYDKDMLLDYLELSRKIFVSQYEPSVRKEHRRRKTDEREQETILGRELRLAMERFNN